MTLTDRPSTPTSTSLVPIVPVPTSPVVDPDDGDDRGGTAQTLRRMFAAGASLTALLLLVAFIAGAVSLTRLTAARETLLDGVGPAVRANQSLEVALLNEETGIRGYALTQNPEFLSPYREGLDDEAAALGVLREYLADRPEGAQVDEVARAVQAWRSGYAEPVAATAAGSVAPDPTIGKTLFDATRAPLGRLTAVLDTERLTARNGLNSAADALRWVGIAIAVAIAAFLAAAAWGLRRGVLEPIAALADQVRAVVSGDVHREVRGSGPQEIVGLGADVDAMRVHISNEVDVLQQVNQRLDDQARDLERSNRDLEQFAYVASHDLQEPLRKVAGFTALLQKRYEGRLDKDADEIIQYAVDGATRMQMLIKDILAYSRVGSKELHRVPVDANSTMQLVTSDLSEPIREHNAAVDWEELPTVRVDASQLRQILQNLVENAVKYRHPKRRPKVHVRAYDDGAAFRYALNGESPPRVPDEATKFILPAGSTVWYHDLDGHYEGVHEKKDIEDVPEGDNPRQVRNLCSEFRLNFR